MFDSHRYFPTLLIVLLAVFNDGAMIALSKDRVVASRMPNSWHLGAIFGQGTSPGRSSSLPCTRDLTLSLTWWSPRTCPACAPERSLRPGHALVQFALQAFVCHESTLILTW